MRVSSLVLGVCFTLVAALASAEDSVAAARERYVAAEYEEALAMLDRLKQRGEGGADQRTIDQYRAYCLLALDRAEAADEAITAVIVVDPLYQPSDEDASPRIRNAFHDARRRALPAIVQQRYTAAKSAFDRKQYEAAARGFEEVLQLMAAPELKAAVGKPPLADLQTLATGFHDLSVHAATPPPVATVTQSPLAIPIGKDTKIYAVEDARIIAPTPVQQSVPSVSPDLSKGVTRAGVLELVIDETGAVQSAIMRVGLGPRIDAIISDAARKWTYQPARLDGKPVKYRKLLQIDVRQ
jgi:tetratricopeptide (TPR) repeat protein